MAVSAKEVHELKKAPRVSGVLPVFHERWSPRSFSGREISGEHLALIFEAARWAASAFNDQPWRFLVGARGSETYNKIFAALSEFNQKWAKSAPVLVLGAARTKFSHDDTENGYALYDLGAAASYLTLQAASLGIAAHQMAGFDHEKAQESLGIPKEFVLGAAIAFGYQDEPEKLGDQVLIEREVAPRSRKALGEFVFESWGKAAKL